MNGTADVRPAAGLQNVYIATAALLLAHQIDAAYWHEWTLLGIPGGVELFVLLNVPLAFVFLYGLALLVRAPRVGARFGVALALVGVAAFVLHAWLIWRGNPEFTTLTSLGVLTAAFVFAIELARRSVRLLRG